MIRFDVESEDYRAIRKELLQEYHWTIGEYTRLEDLGALTLLALAYDDDEALEMLADLLAAACPTSSDLLILNERLVILENALWKRFEAVGGGDNV